MQKQRQNSIEDSEEWPQPVVVFIRCRKCQQFMDDPHCEGAGCPWCKECG